MKDTVFQEKKIQLLISKLQSILSLIQRENETLDHCEPGEEEYINRSIENHHSQFNSTIKDLYVIVLRYLESHNSKELIEFLKTSVQGLFNKDHQSIESEYDDDWEQTFFWSSDFNQIRKCLLPFEVFDTRNNTSIGLVYLENILESTSSILKELGIVPESEPKVYNAVKHVIKSTFPDYKNLTEAFYKEAKCYKPDILIPSLSTAIEYKYAADEQRLIKTIEDILIDVAGYSNHNSFKIFYAVFYVKPGIWPEKRFKEVWDGYQFPDNWRPIYVIGE